MNINERHQDGITILTVEGRVTMQTAHHLLDKLKRRMKKATGLIISMADVAYMDSSGVGVLVTALKLAKDKGIPLALAGINERVGMVMEMSGLVVLFKVYPDEQAALSDMNS